MDVLKALHRLLRSNRVSAVFSYLYYYQYMNCTYSACSCKPFKTISALFIQAELEKCMVGSDTVDPIITEIVTRVS